MHSDTLYQSKFDIKFDDYVSTEHFMWPLLEENERFYLHSTQVF